MELRDKSMFSKQATWRCQTVPTSVQAQKIMLSPIHILTYADGTICLKSLQVLMFIAKVGTTVAALQWHLGCSKSTESQKVCLDKLHNVMAQGWGGTAVDVDTGERGGHLHSLRCTNELSGK